MNVHVSARIHQLHDTEVARRVCVMSIKVSVEPFHAARPVMLPEWNKNTLLSNQGELPRANGAEVQSLRLCGPPERIRLTITLQ